MKRIAITAVLFLIAALLAFALFYVVGAALGVMVFALLGVAVIGLGLYGAVRWQTHKRNRRSVTRY